MGRLRQTTEEIQNLLDKVEQGEISATSDWNAPKNERGHINNRTHYIDYSTLREITVNADAFDMWEEEDEYGDITRYARSKEMLDYYGTYDIVAKTIDNSYIQPKYNDTIISLSETGTYVLQDDDVEWYIKLEYAYDDEWGEGYKLLLSTQSHWTSVKLHLSDEYGVSVVPLQEYFIPGKIARQNAVDELRDETTALWENLDHGTFPNLVAGDLAGRGESVPAEFGFRASGGKSIKDGRAYIKRIKGNSVVWNQWAKSFEEAYMKPFNDGGITYNGNKVTIDNWLSYQPFRFDIKCSTAKDHLYLVLLNYANTNTDQRIYIEFGGENSIDHRIGNIAYFHRNVIYNNEYKDAFTLYLAETLEGTVTLSDLQVIDLTKMFGEGNEPSTIEEYNARVATLGIDMYAYNEGQVIHCNTESIKSIGDNALNADRSIVFDFVGSYENHDFINTEDAFVGISADGYVRQESIDYAEKIEGGFRFRSNGGGYGIGLFVKALPNQEYSVSYASDNGRIVFGFYDKGKNLISYDMWENRITTPSNCEYIMLCMRDNEVVNIDISFTDIMLTLVHSGWKQDTDAGYQPYWEDTLPLPIIRKYFPDGMKKWDRIIKKDGKGYAVNATGKVNLGTLEWSPLMINERLHFTSRYNQLGAVEPEKLDKTKAYGICSAYEVISFIKGLEFYNGVGDKVLLINHGYFGNVDLEKDMLCIYDSSYTDVESFKAMLQEKQVILYYELAEPIVTEITEDFRDYYNVADFGTEMSQSNVPSAPFSADIIYQFNAVDMIREHELEITELQNVIATMQAQLTSLINGGQ